MPGDGSRHACWSAPASTAATTRCCARSTPPAPRWSPWRCAASISIAATPGGILHHLPPDKYFLLANTAGCYSADEAIRYARLAREAGFNDFVKLEVIGDKETLLPDVAGLLEATAVLAAEGFKVLAYTNDDLVTALRLEAAGAVAVMPLASPIGSGLGLLNPYFIRTIKSRLKVPVIVDAGVGTASDACLVMEQGVDGILMNTALAEAPGSGRHGERDAARRRGRARRVSAPVACRGARSRCRPVPTTGMLD